MPDLIFRTAGDAFHVSSGVQHFSNQVSPTRHNTSTLIPVAIPKTLLAMRTSGRPQWLLLQQKNMEFADGQALR